MKKLLPILLLILFMASSTEAQTTITGENILLLNKFGGLNTWSSDYNISPNEFRQLVNLDLNRNIGSPTKRFGYDSVGTVGGTGHTIDSLLGIYGASYSDGRQRLVMVGDSTGVGYGNVYVTTNFGSVNVGATSADSIKRVATYWGIQNITTFAMLQNDVYMTNGQQRGLILTQDGKTRTFPIRAGGEPLVVPLKHATGEINGEVSYSTVARLDTTSTGFIVTAEWRTPIINGTAKEGLGNYLEGVLTAPVYVNNGRVLLTNFPEPQSDTTTFFQQALVQVDSVKNATLYWITTQEGPGAPDTAYFTSDASATLAEIRDSLVARINAKSATLLATAQAVGDSTIRVRPDVVFFHFGIRTPYLGGVVLDRGLFKLFRSRINEGIINRGDSANLIASLSWGIGASFFSTLKVTDSIAGGSPFQALLFTDTRTGRDSTRAMTYRYGALGYLSGDDVVGAFSTDSAGMFNGWPVKQPDTLGFAYTYTWIDTLLAIEGDTAHSLFVYVKEGQTWDGITLRLPEVASLDTGLVLNLYRAPILQITHDSGFWKADTVVFFPGTSWENQIVIPGAGLPIPREPKVGFIGALESAMNARFRAAHPWIDIMAPDSTIVGGFHLVKQIPITDTIYTDTLSEKNVRTLRPYHRASPPTMLKNLAVHGDRIYGSVGSRLYFSKLDSGFAWGAFNFISLDESDGDEITVIQPARDVIRVYKNKSQYNVFQDAAYQWNRMEVSGYIGCVAPQSLVSGLGGTYYLSAMGVIGETEGQYRDRTFGVELASDKIRELRDYSIDTKRACVAHYLSNGTVIFSFPTKDTSFVLFEQGGGWGTWSFAIGGSTNYAKEISATYTAAQFLPMDTMYFFKPGGKKIYRYGSSEADEGVVVQVQAKTAPFLMQDMSVLKQVNRIGLLMGSSATDSIFVELLDEENNQVMAQTNWGAISSRYKLRSLPNNAFSGRYYTIRFRNGANAWGADTKVDGIEVFWNIAGQTNDN